MRFEKKRSPSHGVGTRTRRRGRIWAREIAYYYSRDDERDAEAGDDLGNLLPEVRALHFFLRRAPRDVVREQVREKGLREMDAQAAKEEETAGGSNGQQHEW